MDSNFKALIEAVEQNSLTSVQEILSKKTVEFDINQIAHEIQKTTILHEAVQIKNIDKEIVKLLLDHSAKVNVQNISGESPLHFAVEKDNVDVAELLLEHGGNPDCRTADGCTPLNYCFQTRNILLLDLLLKYKADVNIEDSNGNTLLHKAAKYGTFEMVQRTVEMGMDVNKINYIGKSPLHEAARDCIKNVDETVKKIRLLVHHEACVNELDQSNDSALMLALYQSNLPDSDVIEIVDCLLDLEADPNLHGREDSPLSIAARKLEVEAVEELIEHGADVHFKDWHGKSLFHHVMAEMSATDKNQMVNVLEIIAFLLMEGATPVENDYRDMTPLMNKILNDCIIEYNDLRIKKICESYPLTCGDLLFDSKESLVRHLRRQDVRTALRSCYFSKQFFCFSDILEEKYLDVGNLIIMRYDFVKLLNEVFKNILPHDVNVLISEYLTEDDLKKCFNRSG